MSDRIWFLKRCPLFERLTPAESHRLEANSTLRSFSRRQIIYFPGEAGQTVLVLARGRVKIKSVTSDGRESILAFIDEGELFGELAILDAAPRGEFAEAVEPSQVLAVPRDDIVWLMERRPEVALHVTKLFGFRLRRVENRLRNILFRSNRERVVALLLELLDSHGQKDADGWEIRLRLSHQDLANLIGATRETVTVTLGQLQRDGLIEVRRQRIRVLKRARLLAESDTAAPTDRARPMVRPQ
jgi:CRP/FNR family cyclic AMP-dependent transcriptional regulator